MHGGTGGKHQYNFDGERDHDDLRQHGFGITGTASFTNGIGNGTIAATVAATALGTDPVKTTFTITLASGGTLTGNLSVPQSC